MERYLVLVVDDDEDVLDMIRLHLTRAGLHADAVTDAESALRKMEQFQYPVVLLDINMPGMSGVELLAALKAQNSLVQVIMLTGHHGIENVIECMDRGATDFFAKSANQEGVAEAVGLALGRSARWLSWLGKNKEAGTASVKR